MTEQEINQATADVPLEVKHRIVTQFLEAFRRGATGANRGIMLLISDVVPRGVMIANTDVPQAVFHDELEHEWHWRSVARMFRGEKECGELLGAFEKLRR